MPYSIHDKTLAAKKARILINALVDCAKAGIKPSSVTKKMLSGISLYMECGSFTKENWRTYHRVSDAAERVRTSGDEDWKRKLTFEHARPLSVMYQMLRDERAIHNCALYDSISNSRNTNYSLFTGSGLLYEHRPQLGKTVRAIMQSLFYLG
jgi:hypothetical protein